MIVHVSCDATPVLSIVLPVSRKERKRGDRELNNITGEVQYWYLPPTMSAAADDTDDLNIRIGPSHSVAVAEVPNIIEHVGKVLRMHMGDAAGADALEILALYWQERADANGPKKVVPWNNTPLGSSHGPRRHPGELQLRRARTLSLIRNHENVEHWPVPVMKFLTRAGGHRMPLQTRIRCSGYARRPHAAPSQ